MKNNLYVGLVHFPVYNKYNEIVTTSITNLDIHDISRSCLTYNVKAFYCINRLQSQRDLFQRIISFWKTDKAKEYNQDRVSALEIIDFQATVEDVIKKVRNQEENEPVIVTTTAANLDNQISYNLFIKENNISNRPVILLFGTGNGLANEILDMSDYILEPISGLNNYNHLSVRSAVAIILDRLSSDKYKEE